MTKKTDLDAANCLTRDLVQRSQVNLFIRHQLQERRPSVSFIPLHNGPVSLRDSFKLSRQPRRPIELNYVLAIAMGYVRAQIVHHESTVLTFLEVNLNG
ncbi:hypothetical protein [Bradyrhizobium liaoningense]|uniref:hypothetical protein n=1 Tax=Bradyrhizobium liaoningense TaxID=43992 RepID=UPI001BA9C329|nr:hypothetical protein [Bradyrhizobium liaoningense]MBR0718937.1 hypothetical protein [Bradyrhizobium liaoningense]